MAGALGLRRRVRAAMPAWSRPASSREQVAQARQAVLNQLLAWERATSRPPKRARLDDRLYVFTPQATIVRLARAPRPSTSPTPPHTDLRPSLPGRAGRQADGVAQHPLQSAPDSREILAAGEGGPSLDWLNPNWAPNSQRSRQRCGPGSTPCSRPPPSPGPGPGRAPAAARGQTAVKHDDLAARLGFKGCRGVV